ncbi:MAG: tRNA (adenosine(37)-N6)-dimethylallyltransferase MiaA [Calditrichaeota bacterium]|nr:tRNA (adenosine(37)-N6)-dimethylallyltransferase MiaA [Calditrichota bacterium]
MNSAVNIIVGPTAVGKTRISLLIAERADVEIVSADSRQIYRYMDIGTAKVEKEIRERIPHHFIDICNPDEYYSAGMFGRQARETIGNILNKGKIPLVVGGSGLYIRALTDGIFELNAMDPKIREQLEERLNEKGLPALYEELKRVDPEYARKISPNDRQRILRSLEVYLVTDKPFSYWHSKQPDPAPFPVRLWGLTSDRKKLYRRINERVDQMIKAGLEDEVRNLLKLGYSPELNALNTVGYKEVIDYFEGRIAREEMIDLIKRNSRRYAKRQLTWFRADSRIQWRTIEDENDLKSLCGEIIRAVESQ